MTPIKTLEFDNFSIKDHVRYANDQETNRTANLPKHPNIGRSISGSFSASFPSKLENLGVCDTKNNPYSEFGRSPKPATNVEYFFSYAFFSILQSASNKFENFLKKEQPLQDKAISTLSSFFKETEALRITSALIDSNIKRFHKG